MEPGINCLFDIQIQASKWSDNVCIAYSRLHSLTQYDSTNSFSGKGSKSTLYFIARDADLCREMCFICESFEMDPEVCTPCEMLNLLCLASNLYIGVNCLVKGNSSLITFPPTKDALWHLRG